MIEFHRTAISIHQDTFGELEVKQREMGRNLSWICDSALTRYFSMINQAYKKVEEKFSNEELDIFAKALKNNWSSLRNSKIPQLRMMIRGMEEECVVPRELSTKILDLPSDEFLALLDTAEKRVRKR